MYTVRINSEGRISFTGTMYVTKSFVESRLSPTDLERVIAMVGKSQFFNPAVRYLPPGIDMGDVTLTVTMNAETKTIVYLDICGPIAEPGTPTVCDLQTLVEDLAGVQAFFEPSPAPLPASPPPSP